MLPKTTFPFAEIPSGCTVTLLDVEDGGLRDVDKVRNEGGDAPYDSHQNPSLSAVKPGVHPSAKVSPLSEVSDTKCIGDTVMDPVCGRKLIVPNSLVNIYRRFRVLQAFVVQRPPSLRAQGSRKPDAPGARPAMVLWQTKAASNALMSRESLSRSRLAAAVTLNAIGVGQEAGMLFCENTTWEPATKIQI